MLHIFSTAANAVLPIVLLILFGNLLRKVAFLNDNFVKVGNKLVFTVGLTCSLFVNVYNIDDFSSISWGFILFVYAVTVLLFILQELRLEQDSLPLGRQAYQKQKSGYAPLI